jgi:hypothetical protein
MSKTFRYDVAFSFLAEDEGLAMQLNDLLQDRFKTFVYSEQQKILAGTDGEATFNAVFGQEARTVVVLYRDVWGQTPWTRIEETAIRNRAYHEGYNFALFIVLSETAKVPDWLPKTQLWYTLHRFGINGAAAVIEHKIVHSGGEGREESVLDRAARLKRAQKFQVEKEAFHKSKKGVDEAIEAVRTLIAQLESSAKDLNAADVPVRFNALSPRNALLVGNNVVLVVNWSHRYANSLDEAKLHVDFYDGVPRLPGLLSLEEPNHLKNLPLTYQLVGPGRGGWVDVKHKEYSTEQLADVLLKLFMDFQLHQTTVS